MLYHCLFVTWLVVQCACADISSSRFTHDLTTQVVAPVLDAGVWRLVCTHNGNLVHAHPFLVLPSSDNNSSSEDADKSSILEDEKSDPSAWMKKYVPQFYNVTEHCLRNGEGSSCEHTAWSSVLYKFE